MALGETKVTVADIGDATRVVAVEGELDLYSADALRDALADDPHRGTIVDLVQASFLDSTALGLIMSAAKRAERAGGSVVVVASDPRIVRVFQLTGLDRRVRVERSLADAIEHVLAPAA